MTENVNTSGEYWKQLVKALCKKFKNVENKLDG